MNFSNKRIKKLSKKDFIISKIQQYAYLETVSIIGIFSLIGYFLNPQDIYFVNTQPAYILVVLAILTLFHGFENGLVAIGSIAFGMWFFYPEFPSSHFLVLLLLTMLFSEFQYYWTKKIKELQVETNYKSTKLNELSNAFYTLKISHDQLEKSYIVKPMSIRSAIEEILSQDAQLAEKKSDREVTQFYKSFLELLEKSFSVESALILHKNLGHEEEIFSVNNVTRTYSALCKHYTKEEIEKSYLFDRALNFKRPIFISDKTGEPNLHSKEDSNFLIAIPFSLGNDVTSMLLIEKISFMAFNRENLTSIAILFEHVSMSLTQISNFNELYQISSVSESAFLLEYNRLHYIYDKYNVNSSVMILKLTSELQTFKLHEKIATMLRALDMVTLTHYGDFFYIILLFPLNDTSAALGFLNRLRHNIDYEKDKDFEVMHFGLHQTNVMNKYIEDNYER